MEVKSGYKQTEVGALPDDWEVKPFQTLANIERGKFTARPRNDPKYYGGDIPFIQTGDVTNSSGWIKTYSQTLNREGLKVSKLFPRGTLFFTIAANIGDVGFAGFDTACPDSLVAITTVKGIDQRWLAHELGRRKSSFENLASHNAQLNINLEKLRPYLLPVPPPAEQEAIAEALSDADALIESLEQLVTKKCHLKQGAMQKLLTGKRRLPGFSGEWEPFSLGSIADTNQRWSFTGGPFGSNLKSSDYTDVGVRIIQLQNIGDGKFKDDYEIYTSRQKADELLSCNIYPDEIILSKMGDPVARACIIPPFHERYVMCSDGIRLAVDEKRFNTYFVYTQINAPQFRVKAENAGTGSTRKRIGLTELRSLELQCPPPPEQTAIANVLSDMDAEIATLEAKLTKTRQLKQGMMQELLTGRIRLI